MLLIHTKQHTDSNFTGGENISSVALESMLATHPHILEVAVVALDDEKWGEVPKAYITIKEGKELLGVHVIEWAKNKSTISKFMVPKEVEILDELPKTSTGKTRKNVLREMAKGKKPKKD
jgi:acyl-coenzyme A synthetase/AMP-(fatty) acid ligase